MDWDEDGDFDLVVGERDGYVNLFINSGSATDPVLDAGVRIQDGTVDMKVENNSSPVTVDWDNDGIKDLLMGTDMEGIWLFPNIGTNDAPVFDGHIVVMPWQMNFPNIGNFRSRPQLLDLNYDGLPELLTGNENGMITYYINIGTVSEPDFDETPLPLCYEDGTEIDITDRSYLELFDWDCDGLEDLIIGCWYGESYYLSQIPPAGQYTPAAPSNCTVTPDPSGALSAQLEWICPSLNYVGNPLNELTAIIIYRDDVVINIDTNPVIGEPGVYTDTTIPETGSYIYEIQAVNSFGEGPKVSLDPTWIGDALSGIVIVDLDSTPTGAALQTAIQNNYDGTVFLATDIDTYPLTSSVDAAFVLLGMYNTNHNLTEDEAAVLTAYLDIGGSVYMEGGDTFAYNTATSVHPYFNIDGIYDGSNDLSNVVGEDFLEGMNWTYGGGNFYIDHLEPISPAVTIFTNTEAGYDCGVAYDSGTYKTVGVSFEITGLGGTNTLDEAIVGILDFLGTNAPPLLPPTNLVVESNPADDFATFSWEAPVTEDLIGYDVYLDDLAISVGNTSDLEWLFTDLVYGQTYTAGVVAVYDDGNSTLVTVDFTFDGTDAGNALPCVTELTGNYPNPFNPTTTISFATTESTENTALVIYNLKGQKVKTLVNECLPSGKHSVVWNGKDDAGKDVSSGMYFYQLKSGTFQQTKKTILMK